MQLTKGTRVLLMRDTRYTPTRNNPTEGSSYECVGEISFIGKGHYRVDWDNGTSNGYVEGDLRPAHGCVDLWGEI